MLKSQEYTFNKNKLSVSDMSEKANICFEENGFCVIDDVILKRNCQNKDEIINAK